MPIALAQLQIPGTCVDSSSTKFKNKMPFSLLEVQHVGSEVGGSSLFGCNTLEAQVQEAQE